ncbi:hypothetical protein AJ80_00897 [Polytolypa hystricis UAMH7299]|uniref:Uncharacterized protein n=1 Tax=Polytolypa hystricis (strain UAMH7299) TaxID=1447883 RepID=A0A2B7Z2F9_POLH7|nr:hypothetical protein AJ80_00897 [Polytolypa hystricis UAMH7299]
MSFLDLAVLVEGVAAGHAPFIIDVPEEAVIITSTMSELYGISSVLRSMEIAYNSYQRHHFNRITHDVELIVRSSLRYTIDAMGEMIVAMRGDPQGLSPDAFRRTWFSMRDFFYYQAGYPIDVRLGYYKKMLQEMDKIVKGELPDEDVLSRYRARVSALRVTQDREFAAGADRRRHSYGYGVLPPAPAPPPPPPAPIIRTRPRSRTPSPPLKSALRRSDPVVVTPVPRRSFERQRPSQPPRLIREAVSPRGRSPILPPELFDTSSSSDSEVTDSSPKLSSKGVKHWATAVFHVPVTATALTPAGDFTKCYGTPNSDALERLEKEYDRLLEMSFTGQLRMTVSFYLRGIDGRGRMLCTIHRSKTRPLYATMPLSSLQVHREDSCLQLCQHRPSSRNNELDMWANLQFTSFERLVVFYCTFIALRGQDSSFKYTMPEAGLEGENELFAAPIRDDDYNHALRILQDEETKAIRIDASAHEGALEGVPIWTAFIHQHVRSKTWARQVAPKVIHLSELERVTFISSDLYKPQVTSSGAHVLKFTERADADGFVKLIRELHRESRRR